MKLLLLATLLSAPQTDPNNLSIGRKGTMEIEPGQLVNTATGKLATIEEFANACKGKKFVYLGENHATKPHQDIEAGVVEALLKVGLIPTVGVEFFQRPKQDVLDLWSAGSLSEADFLAQSEWKAQWGYSYDLYRPLFEVIRKNKLGVVGLNVPRDWVRKVGRGGFDALPVSAKMQLPLELGVENPNHKVVFNSLMGGHDMGPSAMNMYSAQVLWDEGMADTAIKYVQVRKPSANGVFVVIAGSGHIMYGQGINFRIARRKAGSGISLVMIQADKKTTISRGLGDFVFVSQPDAKQGSR
jgi:uncharacterized iron-regulated protein